MNVQYKIPERESGGDLVHIASVFEGTVCGLQLEGEGDYYDNDQNFVPTQKKANCRTCIAIVEHCKQINSDTYKGKEDFRF